MASKEKAAIALDDIKIHVKVKLSALWASVVLCYIYGDYFGLYVPGILHGNAGRGNGATRTSDTRDVVGDLNTDGDSERHGFPVAGVKAQPESPGEPHLGCDLYGHHAYYDAGCLGLLHILGSR